MKISTTQVLFLTLLLGLSLGLVSLFGGTQQFLSASEGREIPLADGESSATATFSMYCYWTGEATLGRVPGVLSSRIGHFAGREIVQVDFDPEVTDLVELTEALKRKKSFYGLLVPDEEARDSAQSLLEPGDVEVVGGKARFIEPKHSLRTRYPEIYALDLTEQQAIALNSWSYFGGPMPQVLTPEQKQRLKSRR
ncbi:MAG: hypothetical protein K0U98_14385 [Deltaproteobacteria bacterium]|nr:hypothetical protein [Deltaproteobacteria bacterium]